MTRDNVVIMVVFGTCSELFRKVAHKEVFDLFKIVSPKSEFRTSTW